MHVRSKVWLEEDGALCFGAGKARILKAVEKTGSLSQAARRLGMSYRHAWSAIRAAEQRIGEPLLIRRRGGNERGGAELTDYAKDLLARYRRMDVEIREFVGESYARVFGRNGGEGGA